jgi:hypothetical protein
MIGALVLVSTLTVAYPYSWAPGKIKPGCTAAEVCAKGYTTRSVRPPDSYTKKLKLQQMKAHHLPGKPSDYEEDHVDPLTACGDPVDPANLAPQPYLPIPGAHQKDLVEMWWHKQLCEGNMTPQDVLNDIPNWPLRYQQIKAEGD